MDNTTRVVLQLVKLLRIPVTTTSITKELQKHPEYPSLLSISEVLAELNIENYGYQIQHDSPDLINIPSPFIAHIQDNKFITVKQIEHDQVVLLDKKNKEQRFDISTFQQSFTGNFLVVDAATYKGEADYSINKFREILHKVRLPFVAIGLLITLFILTLFYSSFLTAFTWQKGLLTLFTTTGLVTSILLLIETIDSNNPFIRRFCQGKAVNCQMILSSKAAKILWGELSWSEVGFFYFAGSLLLLLFNSTSTALMQLLAILNIISLPYTFYSIYYQKFVAKKWCALCCTVQLLLWLQFFLLLPQLTQPISFPTGKEWLSLYLSYFSPILFWVFIKPFLLRSQQSKATITQLKKFKDNFQLFKKALTSQVQYKLLEEKDTLMLGNLQANNTVTIVTNPFCSICDQINETLEKWVLKNDNFKLQIVFAINDQQEDVKEVAHHLLNLYINENKQSALKALTAWHHQATKDYTSWATAYPTREAEEANTLLIKQQHWCQMIDVRYTPTILINGYKLPELYQVEDIKYFLFNNHLN